MERKDLPKAETAYERIFHPRRIVIVGVSKESVGFGSAIFMSLRTIGFQGEIFLVNPKGGSLLGTKIYPTVEDIPGDIDFAIIAVVARAVPDILEACRRKGAAGAEIMSAGFKELGTAEGIALEKQIREIAAKGIRVIGPNCFGIYCPESGLTFMPGHDLSRQSGPVAFISQSGGMALDYANEGKSAGVQFSKVVSFGNGADLRETELLRYFGNDPQTRVINMYIEGIENGDEFFATIGEVSRRKPVIVFKGGLSAAGSRAVTSHTASMGGSRIIWPAILRQVNAVQVADMTEMIQASLAFSFLPPRVYKNMSVIGGGGALGVAAADMAESFGIEIPQFPPATSESMMAILPKPGSSAGNPVDVANPFVPIQTIREVLRIGAQDKRIDFQVLISLLSHYKNVSASTGKPVKEIAPYQELADYTSEVVAETGKPVIVVLPNSKRSLDHLDVIELMELARRAFIDRGIPVFDDLRLALRAVGHVNAYYGGKNNE